MAQLTDNKEKMAIVERLVKEGVIDFTEAILLLEKEVQVVKIPESRPFDISPLPYQPYRPLDIRWGKPGLPNYDLNVKCIGAGIMYTSQSGQS